MIFCTILRKTLRFVKRSVIMDSRKMSTDRYIWIDLEMTGLDPEIDTIIEAACIITDPNLKPVEDGIDIVIHHDDKVLETMNDWCKKHHFESGLIQQCQASNTSLSQAESTLCDYIKRHTCSDGKNYLAGNSVYMDLLFLKKYMPSITSLLHYRILDVSSFKIVIGHWYNENKNKTLNHRALDDIKESIEELQYYRHRFFPIK